NSFMSSCQRLCMHPKYLSLFIKKKSFFVLPHGFLYLSAVIPSIWFLELSLLQYKLPVNISSIDIKDILQLGPENCAAALKQTMLIVLVLGRWLTPKGDMARDQLSQLLMAYMGLGADILDIFDTFTEPDVKTNRAVIDVGLALFSWALMHFPLVLTQTCPTKAQPNPSSSQPGSSQWSLFQGDGPFLVYRLYLMIRKNVLNQLMIFFTCKNILVVLLEVYRIFVV
uniref:Uncharacterized protein n=1 Tax=Oncorhynchus kisutch TaxID=8019 RepID=A0A8C7H9H1_ONCKI